MKFGQKGQIIKVTFFDFAVEETVPFPDSHLVLVCDSGIKAQKTKRSKDQFNHRVACYQVGFRLIKKLFPQYAPLLSHLRDVNVRNLNVPLSWIYKILLHLPEQATRKELKAMLPDEDLEPIFATHQLHADGYYPVRGVVLFGLAECERARKFPQELRNERFWEIGRLMNVSHNGDRVARLTSDGTMVPYKSDTSNSYLLNLIEDLESGDIERVNTAQLEWQAGDYHCSIPEIDRMVDTVLGINGVVGAQLAGAGLGGCMMVLVRKDAVTNVGKALKDNYYRLQKEKPQILACRPIAGSGVLLQKNE
jgi:galactokinase